jgi:hypothetical protein
MLMNLISPRRQFDVGCVVEVCNTFDSLAAHVKLEGGVTLEPGDEVLVHGEPLTVPYGESRVENRTATVSRAGWLERAWTRATGDVEFMELCEFSFSERSKL